MNPTKNEWVLRKGKKFLLTINIKDEIYIGSYAYSYAFAKGH
jgi:hypothetical protein